MLKLPSNLVNTNTERVIESVHNGLSVEFKLNLQKM